MKKLYFQNKNYPYKSQLRIISKNLIIIFLFVFGKNIYAQEFYEDFTSATGWTISNGTYTNKWRIGIPTNRSPYLGNNLLYVGNASTGANVNNDYTVSSASSLVHAYKTFVVPLGTTNAYLTFNWRANGENNYDFLRVYLVPDTYIPTPGTPVGVGLALPPLQGRNNFQNLTTTPINLSFYAGTSMKIILEWRNDNSVGNQPPASVDDITISKYCSPLMGYSQYLYFNKVSFIGTLNDVTNSSTYGVVTGGYLGYQDFTRLPNKASQAQGEGVNVSVQANALGRVKAWVDWNKDGNFSTAEEVYDTEANIATSSTIFGFVIPDTQTPGDYRIRIRNYRYNLGTKYSYSYDFDACELFSSIWDEGETEDYLFTVIAQSTVKINSITDGQRCGKGNVNVSATGTAGTTLIRWYDSQIAGSVLGTSASGANFTIVGAANSGEVWATAYDGTRENSNRKKVKYTINPAAVVTFDVISPEICGDQTASIVLRAASDKESVHLVNEKFLTTLNGSKFSNVVAGTVNTDADWKLQKSTYPVPNPPYLVVRPALASGFDLDGFVTAISDVNPGAPTDMRLTLNNGVSAANFTNLYLDYDLYYYTSGKGAYPTGEYANVDISTNGGTSWTTVKQYLTDYGLPNRFKHDQIDLSSYAGQTNLKIRFLSYSYAIPNGWNGDIMALDNIELYGDRPLLANFAWSAPNVDVFAANCTSAYINGPSACFKPNATQLEGYESWTITASAMLSNGCKASGSVIIHNSTKTWNNPLVTNNWNTTNWKPNPAVPDSTKCVVVKTPVILGASTAGAAKNLTVQGSGNLTIVGNLTVTDYIKNTTGNADRLTVKSDANLIQINSTAPNSGSINAERYVTDMDNVAGTQMDYVYWSAPVSGQLTKGLGGFSPGTPANRFFRYNEPNDRFYETGDPTFVPGKGYAVQAETSAGFPPNTTGYSKIYNFRGTPNNGDINYNIVRSPDVGSVQHGFNLIGNPYPSNINFDQLYANNSALIFHTAYFWTNTIYTQNQEGSSYEGNNYAVYSAAGGNPPTGAQYQSAPNGIIKVGQGVIIQKRLVGGPDPLLFKNSYGTGQDLRVTTSGTFYQKGDISVNRFWIKLLSPTDLSNTQLIAYLPEASNSYDQDYDAEILGMSSDIFYSKVEDKDVLIQGKSDFTVEDKVTLGANFFQNGTYTIALENAEGIFDGTQNIYLKDKQENVITNLTQGSYTFTAAKGNNNARFEIIYKPETVLATDGALKDELVVYRDAGDFVLRASTKKMDSIEVYDTAGRMIYKVEPHQTKVVIPADMLVSGIYILKIKQKEEISIRKIIK